MNNYRRRVLDLVTGDATRDRQRHQRQPGRKRTTRSVLVPLGNRIRGNSEGIEEGAR